MFARREAKTRIRQRDWLKLAGEKIRPEQVGSVPTFLSVRANKFAKWKTGFFATCLQMSNYIKFDFHILMKLDEINRLDATRTFRFHICTCYFLQILIVGLKFLLQKLRSSLKYDVYFLMYVLFLACEQRFLKYMNRIQQ